MAATRRRNCRRVRVLHTSDNAILWPALKYLLHLQHLLDPLMPPGRQHQYTGYICHVPFNQVLCVFISFMMINLNNYNLRG